MDWIGLDFCHEGVEWIYYFVTLLLLECSFSFLFFFRSLIKLFVKARGRQNLNDLIVFIHLIKLRFGTYIIIARERVNIVLLVTFVDSNYIYYRKE